jgi:hypothetical protein
MGMSLAPGYLLVQMKEGNILKVRGESFSVKQFTLNESAEAINAVMDGCRCKTHELCQRLGNSSVEVGWEGY